MQNVNDELLKQAEELENQSKIEIRNKNYEEAISILLKARDMYTQLGLTGQVGIILKEIVRLKHLKKDEKKLVSSQVETNAPEDTKIKMEVNAKNVLQSKGNELLEEARNLALNENLDNALRLYNEAYDIFKKINHNYECRQILWQINEIKEHQKWADSRKSQAIQVPVKDIVSLAAAEERRSQIQKKLQGVKSESPIQIDKKVVQYKEEKETKSYKLLQKLKERERIEEEKRKKELRIIEEKKEQRKKIFKERQKKFMNLKAQKQKEENLRKDADSYLNQAKREVEKKNYKEAKLNYEKAIDIFIELGWKEQTKVLRKELWNIDHYKKEDEAKQKLILLKRQKIEQEFENKVKTMNIQHQKYEEKLNDKRRALSPEFKAQLDKIILIKEKANKEESLNKIPRVIERYKYILKILLSIPRTEIDLSTEISNVKQKISELEKKL